MNIPESAAKAAPVQVEFVALVAILISLVALSTDIMLPALPLIGADLGVTSENGTQWVVMIFFVGLCIGQLFAGPLSDRYGRKPVIYFGLAIFFCGCILSIVSWSFTAMLAGRFLQGLGAAAPRIVMVAIVRDQYSGRGMARIMSFVMAVFILVPALAPAVGQLVMLFAGWHMIFLLLMAVGILAFIWFALRMTETLPVERRLPFSAAQLAIGIRESLTNRVSFGYTIAAGLIFGAFIGYIGSAQQIFQVTFHKGASFPFYFGILSLSIGAASIFNSQLVMKYGMRAMSHWALIVLIVISLMFLPLALDWLGPLPLWHFMAWGFVTFFCMGILFGNFNALAMEPLGHIAGIAAAVIGSGTTFISLPAGALVGQLFDGTVAPLVGGFAFFGLASLAVILVTEKGAICRPSS